MTSKQALIESVRSAEREVAAFFGGLTPDEFKLRVDSAWTPAEHLDHLNIAVSAVARGFALPRWLLLLRFGWARRRSRNYQQIRDDYRAALAAGGRARGRFLPTIEEMTPARAATRQQELLARWQRVNARLLSALDKWSPWALERVRLPHPLMGMLTATEMIHFTAYHDEHHVAGARSRLPGRAQPEAITAAPRLEDFVEGK
jgi:hypothetical protein